MLSRVGRMSAPRLGRSIHTTAALLVKRPQKPFEVPRVHAEPGTKPTLTRKREKQQQLTLEHLESRSSFAEKYSDKFGMPTELKKAPVEWRNVIQQFRHGVMPGSRQRPRPSFSSSKHRKMRDNYDPLKRRADVAGQRRPERPQQPQERGNRAGRPWQQRPSSSGDSGLGGVSSTGSPGAEREAPHQNRNRATGRSQQATGYGLAQPGSPRSAQPTSQRDRGFGLQRDLGKPARPTSLRDKTHDGASTAEESEDSLTSVSTHSARLSDPSPSRPWAPTKKLTYAAMAGVRELHKQDPERWTREALSKQFGVSFEAITRILRSKWRDSVGQAGGDEKVSSKWTRSSEAGDKLSPVPIIRKVYELKRELGEQSEKKE